MTCAALGCSAGGPRPPDPAVATTSTTAATGTAAEDDEADDDADFPDTTSTQGPASEGSAAATTASSSAAGSTDPNGCSPGTADCDGDGICEAQLNSAATCGSCDRSCELPTGTLSCSGGSCAGVVVLTDIDDASIDDDADDQNFGAEPTLLVVDDADISTVLLKLNSLPVLPPNVTVLQATLSLTCFDAGSGVEVSTVSGTWSQADVTWLTSPSIGRALTSLDPVEGVNTIELTSLAQTWVDASAPDDGIALHTSGEDDVRFRSREADEDADRPRLELSISY